MERFGPTRRGGPLFRWLGEPLAIDLANTVMVVRDGERVDLLATAADLRAWLDAERTRLGDCHFALAHLDEVRALRDAVHGLLGAAANRTEPPKDALARVNAASAAAPVAPQLVVEAAGALRARERDAGEDRLAQLLGTFARAAIDLVTSPAAAELHVCGAPSCGMYFLGARRWCCAACGNRARAARHYRRSAARPGSPRAGTSA
jgi:predicted RNA-binding Zn ribbon-like protein